MAHIRTTLRNAIVTAITGLTTTGANVYGTRVWRIDEAHLPAARVYSPSEEAELASLDRLDYVRAITIVVEVIAKAAEGTFEVTIDNATSEIEAALSAGVLIGSQRVYPRYIGVDIETDDADKPIGMATMTFIVENLFTAGSAPGTLLPN